MFGGITNHGCGVACNRRFLISNPFCRSVIGFMYFSLMNFWAKLISTLLIVLLGAMIMVALIYLQGKPFPDPGEYHYSRLLRNNFTGMAVGFYVVAAFALGIRFRYNPFRVGISLIGIFPITAVVEATYYRGSHNLIPFEFFIYFLYALPAVMAAFAGNWLFKRQQAKK